MNPILTESASSLSRRIRAGELRSRDVVEAHIERALRVNGTLNAIVRDRYDAAREDADLADAAAASSDPAALPPFHGVPCTIKECFAFRGMPQTGGLVARAAQIAGSDAPAVARIRRAGAIPLGITNVSELCMWMESDNRVYGRTNNPYDPGRIVGGSSGGEGAIVGAGASPFGLGSDIGGSIRMPAFFNGVFGHKPTGGLVPVAGQFPLPGPGGMRYVTAGPLARRAEDLWPLLRVLAGPQSTADALPGDGATLAGDPSLVRMDRLKVVSVPDNGLNGVSGDLRAAQQRVLEHLASRGAHVRELRIPVLRRSLHIWLSMLEQAGGEKFAHMLKSGGKFRAFIEFGRWILRRSPHTLPSLFIAFFERFSGLAQSQARRFIALGQELRAELASLLDGETVLLYPSHSVPAPRHYVPLLLPFRFVYTAIINVMELPATQVPLGLNRRGLPLGVQVVGGWGQDHVTIAVAQELERGFGGWVPPWTVARDR